MLSKTNETRQIKFLRDLGSKIRSHRKALGVSATTTAEAADISRITLYRVEKGESTVTMGAYFSVIQVLGLQLNIDNPKTLIEEFTLDSKLPKKIQADDYPQLKSLAWQIKKKKYLTPKEALDIYERNWRHVDHKSMSIGEKNFLELLLAHFKRKRLLV